MQEKNFGYLGVSFQQNLIKSIIEDKKYGDTIIDVIESKYFENNSFKYIMENLKELHKEYGKIPDYTSLAQKILIENGNNRETSKVHLDTLEAIKNNKQDNGIVKDTALNFCKQQNLKKELRNVNTIIENGDFEEYSKIESIIRNALQVGTSNDDVIDVFFDVEGSLSKDYRHTIPTGINGLDNVLKGGLGKGELGVMLMATGIGKTTALTKIANTAHQEGYNVLQIFFEDNPSSIKRKHYTIWSGVAPDEQSYNVEEVMGKVKSAQENSKGQLRLLKLPSDGTTITDIRNKIRKMIADGFKIDLLIIDYVDCISSKGGDEEWKGEGAIMRALETMASEFEFALWTAVQGSRSAISSEVVTTDQMGGSIKKAQIAHVIISVGKTLEQKEHNLATMTILKSRIGKDGIIFQNCKYDNEYLIIDTESQSTLLGVEQQKEDDKLKRIRDARENFLKQQNQEQLV